MKHAFVDDNIKEQLEQVKRDGKDKLDNVEYFVDTQSLIVIR